MGSIATAFADEGEQERAQEFFARATEAFAYSLELPHSNSVVDYARFMLEWSRSHPEARDRALALYERALTLDPNNAALAAEVATARGSTT